MKRIILLTIFAVLLLTGCGQAAVPESDASPTAAQEETLPAMGTQTVPMETTEDAAKPVMSEVPTQPQQAPAVALQGEPAVATPTDSPATDMPTQEPEPTPDTDVDTMPEQPAKESPSTPVATGDTYSIEEAMRVGNEYAQTQYGVTIDTGMTIADSSYYPGTADSVAWLAEHGGQAALKAAVCGNVDATFAFLAAMDGAETVSAYARFNCTVRYNAAGDEYIVVVLYG